MSSQTGSPKMALYSLTGNARSPLHTEPAQYHFLTDIDMPVLKPDRVISRIFSGLGLIDNENTVRISFSKPFVKVTRSWRLQVVARWLRNHEDAYRFTWGHQRLKRCGS